MVSSSSAISHGIDVSVVFIMVAIMCSTSCFPSTVRRERFSRYMWACIVFAVAIFTLQPAPGAKLYADLLHLFIAAAYLLNTAISIYQEEKRDRQTLVVECSVERSW